jgi:hypothetical protein
MFLSGLSLIVFVASSMQLQNLASNLEMLQGGCDWKKGKRAKSKKFCCTSQFASPVFSSLSTPNGRLEGERMAFCKYFWNCFEDDRELRG